MDVINFRPGDVRGGGNIVSPSKTVSDFDVSDSVVTSVSDTVDGKTVNVFNLGYRGGSYFSVTSGHFVVYTDELSSISLTAVLKKHSDDSAISSATVSCTVNENTTLTGTTNSNGSVTFSIPYDGTMDLFNIRLKYSGTNSIGGCNAYSRILVVKEDITGVNIYADKKILLPAETAYLIAKVSPAVEGKSISFIRESARLYYDTGVTGTTASYWTNSRFDITVSSSGTLLECQSGKEWATLMPISQNYSFTLPVRIELEVVAVTGGVRVELFGTQRFYIENTGEQVIEVNSDGIFLNDVDTGLTVSGDTTTFALQLPSPSYNLKFKDFKIYAGDVIGTVYTNPDGFAGVSVTGDTTGLDTYIVQCDSLISEETSIIDATFYDKGITGEKNTNWENYGNRLTVNVDDEGTSLNGIATANGYYFVNANNKFIFSDYCCEFDVLSQTGTTVRWYHQNQSSSNEALFYFHSNLDNVSVNHVKIVCQDKVLKLYVNDTLKQTVNLSTVAPYEVAFRLDNNVNNNIKFRDFVIYPIL